MGYLSYSSFFLNACLLCTVSFILFFPLLICGVDWLGLLVCNRRHEVLGDAKVSKSEKCQNKILCHAWWYSKRTKFFHDTLFSIWDFCNQLKIPLLHNALKWHIWIFLVLDIFISILKFKIWYRDGVPNLGLWLCYAMWRTPVFHQLVRLMNTSLCCIKVYRYFIEVINRSLNSLQTICYVVVYVFFLVIFFNVDLNYDDRKVFSFTWCRLSGLIYSSFANLLCCRSSDHKNKVVSFICLLQIYCVIAYRTTKRLF